MIKQALTREIGIYWRDRGVTWHSVLFFVMIIAFFPLSMSPSALASVAPGLLWIATLLMILLGGQRLFQAEYDDGMLEQWYLNQTLHQHVVCKLTIYCLSIVLPLTLLFPGIIVLLDWSWSEGFIRWLCLCLGTPACIAVCGLAASACISVSQKGTLMALLLLPLLIPVMIFGSLNVWPMLAAISLISFTFLPFVIVAVLKSRLAA